MNKKQKLAKKRLAAAKAKLVKKSAAKATQKKLAKKSAAKKKAVKKPSQLLWMQPPTPLRAKLKERRKEKAAAVEAAR